MRIGVLTSSRADYGIYQPLLKHLIKLNLDVELIAFGMHLQESQGYTIEFLKKDNFSKIHEVGDIGNVFSAQDVSKAYGKLITDFSAFWVDNKFDLILALGDRWEMSAAVQSSIPFELKLAHIHGGETTLGAIDNIYRHQITLASHIHFTSCKAYSDKVKEIIGTDKNIYNVGSISLDGIKKSKFPNFRLVKNKFQIPFDEFILVTFHPETIKLSRNIEYSKIICDCLEEISTKHNILITKSNSDAMGMLWNDNFSRLERKNPKGIKIVSALGRENYLSVLNQCKFLLGNSSSGIIEAPSFNKWVLNIGDRQKGRIRALNIIDLAFNKGKIMESANSSNLLNPISVLNPYEKQGTIEKITRIIIKND